MAIFNLKSIISLFIKVLLTCVITTGVKPAAAQMSQIPEIPEQMDKISSFVGEWTNTATFFNQEGEVQFKETFNSRAELILGGRAIAIRSFNKGEQAGASWFFYDQVKGAYVMVAIDAWGNYDEFTGNFDGNKLELTSEERMFRNGRKMMWRRTYATFGKQRHEVKMYYSTDGGKTWIYSNRQIEIKKST